MDVPTDALATGPALKRRQSRWFVIGVIVCLSAFFFVTSIIQLVYLQELIHNNPKVSIPQALAGLRMAPDSLPSQQLAGVRLQSLVVLEKAAMENHYHQINMLLVSRIWITYTGFVTGMIMAIVGVVFVLSKLRFAVSELNAKISAGSLSFKTASPGLLLCVLGTILMGITMVVNHSINGSQNAVYLSDKSFVGEPDFETFKDSSAKAPLLPDTAILSP